MSSLLHRKWRSIVCGCVLTMLTGCATMPAPGPSIRDVTENAGPETGYSVVPLAPSVIAALDAVKLPSLSETFGNVEPATTKILAVGDIVSVTIWDAGGGLFAPGSVGAPGSVSSPGTETTIIPNQTIDAKGNITIPFGGQLHVAGKSTFAAQEAIRRALSEQTLKPQALVSVVTDQSNLITVIGDVKVPGRVLLNPGGSRALDAVALAGGTTAPAYDMIMQLTRGDRTKRVRMSSVLERPGENVYLKPNDILYLLREPKSVSVLGALKNNARVEFDTEHLTLAEALGQAGGLIDIESEPEGVFVFRLEPAGVVAALKNQPAIGSDPNAKVPVVFQADLRHAQDLFLAQAFQVQDKDIVYVANADAVQIDKVLKVLLHAAGIAGVIAGKNGIATVN